MSLYIDHKPVDGPAEQPQTAQFAHVGFDMHRIDPLVIGSDLEHLGWLGGHPLKHEWIRMLLGGQMAHRPPGLLADVLDLVRLFGDVQGVAPPGAKGRLIDGLSVGQVVHLL